MVADPRSRARNSAAIHAAVIVTQKSSAAKRAPNAIWQLAAAIAATNSPRWEAEGELAGAELVTACEPTCDPRPSARLQCRPRRARVQSP
jgi:hypothetical protein